MTERLPENDLEVTMRLARSGELPSERLAPALLEAGRATLRQVSAASSTRYFIREQMVEGQVVPVSVFRRYSTPEGPVDERLLDVDSWTDDRHGTVDKAIRFPLDADIEEISPAAAQDVFDMVARRTYVPLQRR
jgi:hypothetical protein